VSEALSDLFTSAGQGDHFGLEFRHHGGLRSQQLRSNLESHLEGAPLEHGVSEVRHRWLHQGWLRASAEEVPFPQDRELGHVLAMPWFLAESLASSRQAVRNSTHMSTKKNQLTNFVAGKVANIATYLTPLGMSPPSIKRASPPRLSTWGAMDLVQRVSFKRLWRRRGARSPER